MATKVHNTEEITLDTGETVTSTDRWQGIETKYYEGEALSGKSDGESDWKITSGELPPGLSLDSSTSVISGTIDNTVFEEFLEDAIKAYPDSIDVDGDPSSYTLGDQVEIVVTYYFSTESLDSEGKKVEDDWQIAVLKFWQGGVDSWMEGSDDRTGRLD